MRWVVCIVVILFFQCCIDQTPDEPSNVFDPINNQFEGNFNPQLAMPSMLWIREVQLVGAEETNRLYWTEKDLWGRSDISFRVSGSTSTFAVDRGLVEFERDYSNPALLTVPSSYRWPIPKLIIRYGVEESRLSFELENNFYSRAIKDIELLSDTTISGYSIRSFSEQARFPVNTDSNYFSLMFETSIPLSEITAFRIHWKNSMVSSAFPLKNDYQDSQINELQEIAFNKFSNRMDYAHLYFNYPHLVVGFPNSQLLLARINLEKPYEIEASESFANGIKNIQSGQRDLFYRLENNSSNPVLRTIDYAGFSSIQIQAPNPVDLNQSFYGMFDGGFVGVYDEGNRVFANFFESDFQFLHQLSRVSTGTSQIRFAPDGHMFSNLEPRAGRNAGRLIHFNLAGRRLGRIDDIMHQSNALLLASENYLLFTKRISNDLYLELWRRSDKLILWTLPIADVGVDIQAFSENEDVFFLHQNNLLSAIRISTSEVLVDSIGKNLGGSKQVHFDVATRKYYFFSNSGFMGTFSLP